VVTRTKKITSFRGRERVTPSVTAPGDTNLSDATASGSGHFADHVRSIPNLLRPRNVLLYALSSLICIVLHI